MTNPLTTLEPISRQRARRLMGMLTSVQDDPQKAIALDDDGYAKDVVAVDAPNEKAILKSFDVHA